MKNNIYEEYLEKILKMNLLDDKIMSMLACLGINIDSKKYQTFINQQKRAIIDEYVQIDPDTLPTKEQLEELWKYCYYRIKDESAQRKLIEQTMWFVPPISCIYAKITGISIDEINSFGYEGLIQAVKYIRSEYFTTFCYYAIISINRCIQEGLARYTNFETGKLYFDFVYAKQCISKFVDEIEEPAVLSREIVNLLKMTDTYSELQLGMLRDKIAYHYSVKSLLESDMIDNRPLEYEHLESYIRNIIDHRLATRVEPYSANLIRDYYDLDHFGEKTSFDSIAKKYHSERRAVERNIKRNIQKLKCSELEELMELYQQPSFTIAKRK